MTLPTIYWQKILQNNIGKRITILAYYIICKIVPTVRNETMLFGTFIDVDLDWIDTVHFPKSLRDIHYREKAFTKYPVRLSMILEFAVLKWKKCIK